MDVNHENMCIQCVDYEILEEKYNTLKILFDKLILKGGFKDYVFDSLGNVMFSTTSLYSSGCSE